MPLRTEDINVSMHTLPNPVLGAAPVLQPDQRQPSTPPTSQLGISKMHGKKFSHFFCFSRQGLCTEAVFQLYWKRLVLKVCLIAVAIKCRIWPSILLKTLLLTSAGYSNKHEGRR